MGVSQLKPSPIEEHFGYFQFGVIENKTNRNIHYTVFVLNLTFVCFFFFKCLGVRLLGHGVSICLDYKKLPLSSVAVPFTFSSKMHKCLGCYTFSTALIVIFCCFICFAYFCCWILNAVLIGMHVVVFQCLICILLMTDVVDYCFKCLVQSIYFHWRSACI